MSDLTQEKEKSLAELMVRILKEPLKPLSASVKGLEDELADIKTEIEHTTSTVSSVAQALQQSERATKRRDEETLDTLRTSLTEHAQALATLPGQLNEALASTTASLQAQLHDQQTSLAGTLAQWQTCATVACSEQAASMNALVAGIDQRLEQQHRSVQAAHQALLGALRGAAEHSQSVMAKARQDGEALCEAVVAGQTQVLGALSRQAESLNAAVAGIGQRLEQQHKSGQADHLALLGVLNGAAEHSQSVMAKVQRGGEALHEAVVAGQAEVLGALSRQTESLNARLDHSQARVRQLTVLIGLSFVSMLAYVGYDLLNRVG